MREITMRPMSEGGTTIRQMYRYAWGNNKRRAQLKGRHCVIVAAGTMNTVCVEFLDTGERVGTSRRALRRF